tara:strand:- start:413 stop:652 length:240 start_codon:yes stop_codon:yes gene_type:complete
LKARVTVMLKSGILDPQGEAIKNALNSLGYNEVSSIRQGKVIEINLNETSEEKAKNNIEKMCKKLLANTVVENYQIEII